jgi:hypothetical protein
VRVSRSEAKCKCARGIAPRYSCTTGGGEGGDTDLSPCPATHLVHYCVGHRGGARMLVVLLGLNAQQEVVLVHPFLSDPNGLGLGRGGKGGRGFGRHERHTQRDGVKTKVTAARAGMEQWEAPSRVVMSGLPRYRYKMQTIYTMEWIQVFRRESTAHEWNGGPSTRRNLATTYNIQHTTPLHNCTHLIQAIVDLHLPLGG